MKIISLYLFFAIMILGDCSPPKPTPKAEKGVLDLRNWDFSEAGLGDNDGILKLEGEWEFYWEEFLSLEEIKANDLCLAGGNTEKCKSKTYIRFPTSWNGLEFKNKEKSSGYGYATYRLKILSKTDSILSIHTGTTNTSYKLFIENEPLLESGKIGNSEITNKPGRKKQIGILKRETSQNVILQVANFESKYGGPWGTFYIGEYKKLILNRDKNLFLDLFVSGAIFIIGIYHFGLYYKRRKDSTTLWFGLLCQIIFIRGLLTGENFLHSHGENLFYLFLRTEYISIPLGCISLVKFFSSLFSQIQKDMIIKISIYINTGLSIINLLTPLNIYSQLSELYQLLIIFISLYIIIKLVIFIIQKIEFAKTFLFGSLFILISNINDILYSNELISTGFYAPIGLLFFIIFQSYFLSIKYSAAYSKSESLAEDLKSLADTLELKVIERTNELNIEKQVAEKAYKDLQETQSQLIEAERMASLGQLVGGVAHEINNPIGVIRSNSELIAGNLSSMLGRVPLFLESLSEKEKEVFYSLLNLSIENKIAMTSKEERNRKKEIKKELENTLSSSIEQIDFIAEQILLLQLKSPFTYYIDTFGEDKFIESLSIAQIFANQSNSINNIEIAVEKASRVVFALRSYLNTELYLDKKEVDLISEFEKAIHVYDNYIMGKINVYKDYPNELKYNCTSENLSQVWRHLLFNSIQAMYLTDKKLKIRIEKVSSLPERLKNMNSSLLLEEMDNRDLHVNSCVILSITDSGHGIPEHLQKKIFTPFFTTKPLGEGIGLGLYVSKKIIQEHGGRIYFESKEGYTEFSVILPL